MSDREIILSKGTTYNRCLAALDLGYECHDCQLKPEHEGDHTNGIKTWSDSDLAATWYQIVRL